MSSARTAPPILRAAVSKARPRADVTRRSTARSIGRDLAVRLVGASAKLGLAALRRLTVSARRTTPTVPGWFVSPLGQKSHISCITYCEQQLPKREPSHVRPVVPPHCPVSVIAADETAVRAVKEAQRNAKRMVAT